MADNTVLDSGENGVNGNSPLQADAADARRRELISALFQTHEELAAMRDECLADPQCGYAAAGRLLQLALGRADPGPIGSARATVTHDEHDRWKEAATEALIARATPTYVDSRELRKNPYRGRSLSEFARMCCERSDIDITGLRAIEYIGRAFTSRPLYRSQGTSDLPELLSNVAEKSMIMGFQEATVIYPQWTRKGNLPDFKPAKRITPASFGNLRVIAEKGSYQYVLMPDQAEQILLLTYGELFKISRQALINDDLDQIARTPMLLGATARRTVDHLAISALIANPLMADGKACFHADHKNLSTPGAVPDTATVDAARAAVAKQKGLTNPAGGASFLNLPVRIALSPVALGGRFRSLNESEKWVDDTKPDMTRSNPVMGQFSSGVLEHALLDNDNPKSWYVLTDPGEHDCVEVAFLDGEEMPFLDQEEEWTTDGVDYKVRIDAGVKVVDWRGVYKNEGGTP